MTNLRRKIYLALLIAQSLALFLFEGLIPLPFLAPGAKLGLANLVTIVALYTLASYREVLTIVVIRIMLAAFFGGGPSVMLYSLAGGLFSLGMMLLLKRTQKFSPIGISTAGGFSHNLAQIAAAAIIMKTPALFYYLPILGSLGIITGFLIGIVASGIIKRLPRQ